MSRDYKWRRRFAPSGYRWVALRIEFSILDNAADPKALITSTCDRMVMQLAKNADRLLWSQIHTFVNIYPRDVGEHLNCLDGLKPRLGIEIEMCLPISKGDADRRDLSESCNSTKPGWPLEEVK
jgi:hypothetical protein